MNKTKLLLAVLLIISCSRSPEFLNVEGRKITKEDIRARLQIEKVYNSQYYDTTGVIFIIIQQIWRENIAQDIGISITKEKIEKEAKRIDRETKAPHILNRVKEIFGQNDNKYLQHYVKPVLTERLLQEKFLFDTLYQKVPWRKINKAYVQVERLEEPDTSVRVFIPEEDDIASFYMKYLNKGVVEDKYSYFFVKKINKKNQVYHIPKNDFTTWFHEKAIKYPVIIHDENLKKKMLQRVRGSEFWDKVLRRR